MSTMKLLFICAIGMDPLLRLSRHSNKCELLILANIVRRLLWVKLAIVCMMRKMLLLEVGYIGVMVELAFFIQKYY